MIRLIVVCLLLFCQNARSDWPTDEQKLTFARPIIEAELAKRNLAPVPESLTLDSNYSTGCLLAKFISAVDYTSQSDCQFVLFEARDDRGIAHRGWVTLYLTDNLEGHEELKERGLPVSIIKEPTNESDVFITITSSTADPQNIYLQID